MATYLVTGSSRGLGLEIVTQLAALPPAQVARVFATARSDASTALQELVCRSAGRVVYVRLDTTDDESIKSASVEVARSLGDDGGLDVLINNAGIMPMSPGGVETIIRDNLDETLKTNVASTHNVTAVFLRLLRKGSQKKICNISSTLGSITTAAQYGFMPVPAYKISKAALNMLTVQYALSLEKEGFTCISMSPGVSTNPMSFEQLHEKKEERKKAFVEDDTADNIAHLLQWLRTDMGNSFGAEADLPVAAGATALLDAVHKYGKEENGKFYNIRVPEWEHNEDLNRYDGMSPPW
ncbi:MAG: hypothetical protein Q9203_003619 [Teloschistes exilis]